MLAAVLGISVSGGRTWTGAALTDRPWQRSPYDPRWIQGQIDVATPAPAVWHSVASVRGWPSIFSDIESFSVKSESSDGAHWVIRFESRMVGHGRFDYFVTLDTAKTSVRIVVDAPGVRAAAFASVAPIDDRHARVTYAVFVDRHGVLGLFLSESDLRERQERLLELNLVDLGRAFGAARVQSW
jgi:hypothetical protein